MTEDVRRDDVIATALDGIAVPAYEPGFWDRLDARLGAESYPGLDLSSLEAEVASGVDDEPVDAPLVLTGTQVALDELDLPSPAFEVPAPIAAELDVVVPMVRRRGVALLGAAAAVVLAVLALQLADGRPSEPLETASGRPPATLRAPGGGSTTEDGAAVPAAGETDSTADRTDSSADAPAAGSTRSTSSGTGSGSGSVENRGAASGGAGPSGTQFTAAARHDTPQAAFASWTAAVERGDTTTAMALTGPRTRRYHEATGTAPADAAAAWAETYGQWAGNGVRVETLDAAKSDGARVVVLLLDRPATDAPDGRARAALPVVEAAGGWLVEPEARDPEESETVALSGPADARAEEGTVPPDHVIEIAAARRGSYTLAIDRTTTTTVPASEAEDGVIRWDPPDKAMTSGRHVLVVVHVTDDTITTLTTSFVVA